MTTGVLPFRGDSTADIFDSILNRTPTAPVRMNPDMPDELERIIHKSLEKDREVRYQHAADLRADLRRLKRATESAKIAGESPTETRLAAVRGFRKGYVYAAVATVLLALALALGWKERAVFSGATGTQGNLRVSSVAVLPFTSEPAGTEYLSDGIAGGVRYTLSEIPSLKVISSSSVLQYRGKTLEPRQIGRELNVGAVLTGSFRKSGDDIIVQAELASPT